MKFSKGKRWVLILGVTLATSTDWEMSGQRVTLQKGTLAVLANSQMGKQHLRVH